MDIGLRLQEYLDEMNKSDLEAQSEDLIIGLLINIFKDHEIITEEILTQEIQLRLEGLRKYNFKRSKDVA